MLPLAWAAVLLVAVGFWAFYYYSETKRDLDLEGLARERGLNFRFGLPAELREILHRFRAIEKAQAKGADFHAGINSITGTWRGRKIAFFDYRWSLPGPIDSRGFRYGWTDDADRRRIHRRSAVAVELGVGLQPVLVRPERLVDKALALVGYEDIDFDDLPEFSRAFYVNSPDRGAARRLVTPAFARFCLDRLRCTVDFVGPWMLLTRDAVLHAPSVRELMDVGSRLGDLVTREQSGSR
jgi:hypothetical protein